MGLLYLFFLIGTRKWGLGIAGIIVTMLRAVRPRNVIRFPAWNIFSLLLFVPTGSGTSHPPTQ